MKSIGIAIITIFIIALNCHTVTSKIQTSTALPETEVTSHVTTLTSVTSSEIAATFTSFAATNFTTESEANFTTESATKFTTESTANFTTESAETSTTDYTAISTDYLTTLSTEHVTSGATFTSEHTITSPETLANTTVTEISVHFTSAETSIHTTTAETSSVHSTVAETSVAFTNTITISQELTTIPDSSTMSSSVDMVGLVVCLLFLALFGGILVGMAIEYETHFLSNNLKGWIDSILQRKKFDRVIQCWFVDSTYVRDLEPAVVELQHKLDSTLRLLGYRLQVQWTYNQPIKSGSAVVIPCFVKTSLEADVRFALEAAKQTISLDRYRTYLVVFHHEANDARQYVTPTKMALDRNLYWKDVSDIADLLFWTGKGIYSCDSNKVNLDLIARGLIAADNYVREHGNDVTFQNVATLEI